MGVRFKFWLIVVFGLAGLRSSAVFSKEATADANCSDKLISAYATSGVDLTYAKYLASSVLMSKAEEAEHFAEMLPLRIKEIRLLAKHTKLIPVMEDLEADLAAGTEHLGRNADSERLVPDGDLKESRASLKFLGLLQSRGEEISDRRIVNAIFKNRTLTILVRKIKARIKALKPRGIRMQRLEAKIAEVSNEIDRIIELLFHANVLLVVKQAKRWEPRAVSLTLMDLIQEGNPGLTYAIDKFDPRRKLKLSTSATHWISQPIRRALDTHNHLIYHSSTYRDWKSRLARSREKLTQKFGRSPTPQELIKDSKLSPKEYACCSDNLRPWTGEPPLGENGEPLPTYVESYSNAREYAPELAVQRYELEQLQKAIESLDKRERFIFESRKGLNGRKLMILNDLAVYLKMTREGVRQIEGKAMRKVATWMRTNCP